MYSLLLTLLMTAVCSANPLGPGTTIISEPEVFAGSPTMCRRPNSTFCGVNYNVPDIIATLVHVIEDGIRGELELHTETMPGQESNPCQTTTKAILCAQNFPRCEGGNVLLTSTQTCEADIEANCDEATITRLLDNHFCSLTTEVVPLESCSALNTFTAENQLNELYCGQIEGNTLVSEWMFKFIQFFDRKVMETLSGLHTIAPTCSSNYARYFCQFIGECTEDSTAINVKNNYHFCEDTINCYDNTIADLLRPLFPCVRWLNLEYPSPPTSPPNTPSSNNPVSVSTLAIGPSVSSIKPDPISIPLPGNGACALHSVEKLFLYLTVLVTFLIALL